MEQQGRTAERRGRIGRCMGALMAVVCLASAIVGVSVATEPAPEADAFFGSPRLVYSLSRDRVGAQPLNGAVIPAGSNVSIWVDPVWYPTTKVRFDLNGQRWSTERVPPWDFNGTNLIGYPEPVWSGHDRINEGANTITVRIDRGWFPDRVFNATFQRAPLAQSTWTKEGLGLDFAPAETVIDDYLRTEKLNGAGLIVVHPDEGIVHESYRGDITADRISLLASSAKMISAGVLLHLQDQGLLDLNAPISTIPGLGWNDALPGVTTAQLLSNSSGLVGLAGLTPGISGYLDLVNGCALDHTDQLLGCGRSIAENKLDDWAQVPPDTEYRYGGPQWQVAGAIAEQVSGKSWAQLIDEIYVQPCGLESLGYTTLFQLGYFLPSTELLPYPGGFDGNLDALVSTDNPTIEGGGYSTPRDYAELLMMLLRGGMCGGTQVLSQAAIDQMLTDRIGPAYNGETDGRGYGLGWTVDGGIRTDPGLFGAVPWLDLGRGYGAYFVLEHVSLPGSTGRAELIEAVGATIDVSDLANESLLARSDGATLSGTFVNDGEGVGAPNGSGSNGAGASSTTSSAAFDFDVSTAGYYSMVGSVKAPSGRDDSFWVTVNDHSARGVLWDTGPRSAYGDSTVRDRGASASHVVWLEAGPNRVTVHLREDGTFIRSMRLVAEASPPPFQSVADAIVTGDFASDGNGVGVPNGVGNNGAGPASTTSSVTFDFDVATAGNFSMVGSVKAPGGRDDSFWVTANGQSSEAWLWDTHRSSRYHSSTVSHRGQSGAKIVWLEAGPNTITVHLREDGTYIRSMELVPA